MGAVPPPPFASSFACPTRWPETTPDNRVAGCIFCLGRVNHRKTKVVCCTCSKHYCTSRTTRAGNRTRRGCAQHTHIICFTTRPCLWSHNKLMSFASQKGHTTCTDCPLLYLASGRCRLRPRRPVGGCGLPKARHARRDWHASPGR